MKIYTVTLCLMDQEVGANAFWHTCILLSRYDEHTKKHEVVDNYGYYGLPSTMSWPSIRALKVQAGLDVDITGNHGMLRHEEIRYLDAGKGLHGVTFELTEEQFNTLLTRCRQMAQEQSDAIHEIATFFKLTPLPEGKYRIYPYEQYSGLIFSTEIEKAKIEGRLSRLKPFDLMPTPGSNTCKAQAIDLLDGILTQEQIERITSINKAVSRFSGKVERIFLHSSGPLQEWTKRNGEKVYYRKAMEGVKLYWTIPPQEIETQQGETRNLFEMDPERIDSIKAIIRKLQTLEWFFTNAVVEEKYQNNRHELVKYIREIYEWYAAALPKSPQPQNTWANFGLWLLNQPRNTDEALLLSCMKHAKAFINRLYMFAVDGAENEPDKEHPELLAAKLTKDQRREVCGLIMRNYVDQPDEAEEQRKMRMA